MNLLFLLLVAAQPATVVPPIAISPVIRTPADLVGLRTPSEALAAGVGELTPEETVLRAANAGAEGKGIRAVFSMPVQRANKVGPRYFLNSEKDYRDQRNLSVAIDKGAYRALRERYGKKLDLAFRGQRVRIYGVAHRVRIGFMVNGQRTGLYYYQTQVAVTDAGQIEILG
jgi:ribosomal protein S13